MKPNIAELEKALELASKNELSLAEAVDLFNRITGSELKRLGGKLESNKKVSQAIQNELLNHAGKVGESETEVEGTELESAESVAPKIDRRTGPRSKPRRKSWAPKASSDYEFPAEAPKYDQNLQTLTEFIKVVYKWSIDNSYVWPKAKLHLYLMECTGSSKYSINSLAASKAVYDSHKAPYMEMTLAVNAKQDLNN